MGVWVNEQGGHDGRPAGRSSSTQGAAGLNCLPACLPTCAGRLRRLLPCCRAGAVARGGGRGRWYEAEGGERGQGEDDEAEQEAAGDCC